MSRASTLRRPRAWLLVLVAVVVYVALLVAYSVDGRSGPSVGPEQAPPGGVLVGLTPVSVDPAAGVMTVDVEVELDQSLVDTAANTGLNSAPNRDVTVVLLPTVTGATLRLPAHTPITTTRTQLYQPGFIRDWPFDRYESTVIVTAGTGGAGDAESVPVALAFNGALQGWHLWAEPDPDPAGQLGAVVTVGFERALGVVLFGAVVVVVLITLPVLGLIVVINVARGRRKFEPAFLSWIGGMLFATIPIRNFLPGSPPPGSWIDVTVVLWVVVALATGLVIGVLAWLRQSPLTLSDPDTETPDPTSGSPPVSDSV